VVYSSDEKLEPKKGVYTCSICEDKIVLEDETNSLPKCRICNEPEYKTKKTK